MIGAPLAGGGASPDATLAFRRTIAGRSLELLLVRYNETAPGFACYVDDHQARQPLDAKVIAGWAGQPPLNQASRAERRADAPSPSGKMPVLAEWKPGVLKGSRRTLISYTPSGSVFNMGGMVGISLLSQWDEAKELQ